MIFAKKEKQVVAYTLERCPSCKTESKRKFKEGDCLFVGASNCDACKIPMTIAKIFGETTG